MLKLEGFHIESVIQEDRKNILYRAYQDHTPGYVTIKGLREECPKLEDLAGLKNEYEITKLLDFPGIIKVKQIFQHHAKPYLVAEEIIGQDLKSYLAEKPQDIPSLFRILIQVTKLLDQVHERRILHRDLKPTCWFIDPKNLQITLTGFSKACTIEFASQDASSQSLGDFFYTAPELCSHQLGVADYRSDLYALGAVFYHWISHHPPFEESDPIALRHAHLGKLQKPLHTIVPGVPRQLSRIVDKLMAKDPALRYQSCYGLLKDLDTSLAGVELNQLGLFDYADQFILPNKVYGRTKEINTLNRLLERAGGDLSSIALLSGPPGIGKSTLARELKRSVLEKGGMFLSGKFDPFKTHQPYSGLMEAFRSCIQEIMALPPAEAETWRENIEYRLKHNASLLVEAIPELKEWFGPLPAPPTVSSMEASHRFLSVVRDFMDLFVGVEQPLVFFLDDLQWADADSLEFIKRLYRQGSLGHMLWIGAYRGEEVGENHPLRVLINLAAENQIRLVEMALQPLTPMEITSLLMDTLGLHHKAVEELAHLLFQKTGGNPFYIKELLQKLHKKGRIWFQKEQSQWTFDLAQIAAEEQSLNVTSMLVARLEALSPSTLEILKVASALGGRFDCGQLIAASQLSPEVCYAALHNALSEGLLTPPVEGRSPHTANPQKLPETLRFIHDRIQQTCYEQIPPKERTQLHFQIAQRLMTYPEEGFDGEKLFDVLKHFEVGQEWVKDTLLKEKISKLCFLAAKKAKASASAQRALAYLEQAKRGMSWRGWSEEDLFDLKFLEIECLILLGRFAKADGLVDQFIEQEPNPTRQFQLIRLKMNGYLQDSRFAEGLEVGIRALSLIGIPLEQNTRKLQFYLQLRSLLKALRQEGVQKIQHAPLMQDPLKSQAMEILMEMIPATYIVSNNLLMSQVIVSMIRLSLQYGNQDATCYAFVSFGFIVTHHLKDPAFGYSLATMGMELFEKIGGERYKAKVHAVYGYFVKSWNAPLQQAQPHFEIAHQAAVANGDKLYAVLSANMLFLNRYNQGASLQDCFVLYEQYERLVRHSRVVTPKETFVTVKGVIEHYLMEGVADKLDFDRDWKHECLVAKSHHYIAKGRLLFSFGLMNQAEYYFEYALTHEKHNVGSSHLFDLYLYGGLTAVECAGQGGWKQRWQRRRRLQHCLKRLAYWSAYCPELAEYRYLLLSARVQMQKAPQTQNTIQVLEKALEATLESDNLMDTAFGYEMACQYYLNRGLLTIGRSYFKKAKYYYQCYGALGKIRQLEARYPQVQEISLGQTPVRSTTISGMLDNYKLDLVTLMKASRNLMGLVRQDQLLEGMMRIFAQSAGAQRGALVLHRQNQLLVEAYQNTEGQIKVLMGEEVEYFKQISPSIVQYVFRTHAPLVLEEAFQDTRFIRDEYLQKEKVKSVVCLPLVIQGVLKGILYLENNLLSGVFTMERVNLLKVLIGQLGVALENAQLFQKLEQRIQDRTEDLHSAMSQVKEQNRQLSNSIAYISSLQRALLPSEAALKAALGETLVIWQPKERVGGSLYLLKELRGGALVALIDAQGQGIAAAFLSMLVIESLGKAIVENPLATPGQLLQSLHQSLVEQRQTNQTQETAAASLIWVDSGGERLIFAGAGQNLVCLDDQGTQICLGSERALGYLQPEFECSEYNLDRKQLRSWYTFTQGVARQLGDREGAVAGQAKLIELLEQIQRLPAEDQKQTLEQALSKAANREEVALIGVQYSMEGHCT